MSAAAAPESGLADRGNLGGVERHEVDTWQANPLARRVIKAAVKPLRPKINVGMPPAVRRATPESPYDR